MQFISGLSRVNAVNDNGDAAGFYANGHTSTADLYTPGSGLTDLGTLSGSTGGANPFGINAASHIVGAVSFTGGTTRAFLWTPSSGMVELVPNSGLNYEAFAINNSDQVVGTFLSATDGNWHAFLWTPAVGLQDLGVGEGVGIDDAGNIVGDNLETAVIWTKGSTSAQSLDSLLGGEYPPILFTGMSINATGQIACSGYSAGYLLTPITKTKLTSSPNPSNIGQPVTFTATVSSITGTPPDGQLVSFLSGTIVLELANDERRCQLDHVQPLQGHALDQGNLRG